MPSAPSSAAAPTPTSVLIAEQAGPGRPGERALRDRVGHESGPAQHNEEADHPGDHGDDARHAQVLAMNPENMRSPACETRQPGRDPPGRTGAHRGGEQVEEEDQGDHEELTGQPVGLAGGQ